MQRSVPALSTSLNTCCKPRATIIISDYRTNNLKSSHTIPQLSIPSLQPLTLNISFSFFLLFLLFFPDPCATFQPKHFIIFCGRNIFFVAFGVEQPATPFSA